MKRVTDPETGRTVRMKLEDCGAHATLVLACRGKRIEAVVSDIDLDVARTAYAAGDLEIFGQLIAPYDFTQPETHGQHVSGEARRA